MIYSVISYKPNITDSVMGCVQERLDSEHEIETFTESKKAAEYVAKLLMEPPFSKYINHGWEITVLFDGLEENDAIYDPENDWVEKPQIVKQIKDFWILTNSCMEDIKYERAQAEIIANKKKAEKVREAKEIAKKSKEKYELNLLASLKEKYE